MKNKKYLKAKYQLHIAEDIVYVTHIIVFWNKKEFFVIIPLSKQYKT